MFNTFKILISILTLLYLALLFFSFLNYILVGSPLATFHIIVLIACLIIILYPGNTQATIRIQRLHVILLPLIISEILIRIFVLLQLFPADQSLLKPLFPENALQLPLYSNPAITADAVSGYRWNPSGSEVLKIGGNKVEFYNKVEANQQGFYHAGDYIGKKKDSTKRIIVLGDSFTEAFFLKQPWPEKLQQLLTTNQHRTEVYSFGINGGGIVNWHELFFKEIVPHYDFDVIVLAVFGNDLSREFISIHHKNNNQYIKYFPVNEIQQSVSNIHHSEPYKIIVGNRKMAEIRALYTSNIHWYTVDLLSINLLSNGLSNLVRTWSGKNKNDSFLNTYVFSNSSTVDDAFLKKKYGEEKILMLEQIVHQAKISGKEIIIACIPEKEGAFMSSKGDSPQIARELSYLTSKYNIPYFNGYVAYENTTDAVIESHFMTPDGHWNQKGSDFFSYHFYQAYKMMEEK